VIAVLDASAMIGIPIFRKGYIVPNEIATQNASEYKQITIKPRPVPENSAYGET
jgi:hypothetical protein